ncbi:hypothetical protein [Myxococcus stipitatus]|uniref:hypothetical protein n=1 Tax=Myxococcus stipitatus TaxID=83455 RepID=UPI0030CE37B2
MARQHTRPRVPPLSAAHTGGYSYPPTMASSPPPPPKPSLPRAALLGLSGGLLLGGLGLLALGVRGVFGTPDCTGLSGPECELIRQATQEMGRVQTRFGGALVALGAALFVLLRRWRPSPPSTP